MTAPLSEFDLIARYFAPMAGESALGLLDDAAYLTPSEGCDLVLTKDALVEGVHFFPDDPPASIAAKALRVNLSDLAAKGARPCGFLLALGRGPRQDDAWLEEFARILGMNAKAFGIPLLGGDTVKTGQAFFSITAIGEVPKGRMVRRQGGNPGDILFVSGTIGAAALGLQLRLKPQAKWARALDEKHRAHLLDRYLHPQPRVNLAPLLLEYASAAMDISDGLVGDAEKLAQGLGREIRIADIPLSVAVWAAVAAEPALLDTALTGGDDYEIIAAVPPEKADEFSEKALLSGIPVAKIGQLHPAGSGQRWIAADGTARHFKHRSYRHF